MSRSKRVLGGTIKARLAQLPAIEADRMPAMPAFDPDEAARNAPFAKRMTAVLDAITDGQRVDMPAAQHLVEQAAPLDHMQYGHVSFITTNLLDIGLRTAVLGWRDDAERVGVPGGGTEHFERGRWATLLEEHPMVMLKDAWLGELSSDPVADLDCDPRLAGPWAAVPRLLAQLMARAGKVDLADIATGLHREAGALTRRARFDHPLEHIAIGLTVGLCVEFGMAEWTGDIGGPLGVAHITPLGLLGHGTLDHNAAQATAHMR